MPNADNDSQTIGQESDETVSPPGSAATRRRTFWSNFKSRTRKLRSRSADSGGARTAEAESASDSKDAPVPPPAAAAKSASCRKCPAPNQSPATVSRSGHFATSDLDDLDTVYEFPVVTCVPGVGQGQTTTTMTTTSGSSQPTDVPSAADSDPTVSDDYDDMCICMYLRIYARDHVRVHVYMYVCMCACTFVGKYACDACMFACLYVCIYVSRKGSECRSLSRSACSRYSTSSRHSTNTRYITNTDTVQIAILIELTVSR